MLDTATYWWIASLEALGRILAGMQVAIVRLDRFIDLQISTRTRTSENCRNSVIVQLLHYYYCFIIPYFVVVCTLFEYVVLLLCWWNTLSGGLYAHHSHPPKPHFRGGFSKQVSPFEECATPILPRNTPTAPSPGLALFPQNAPMLNKLMTD